MVSKTEKHGSLRTFTSSFSSIHQKKTHSLGFSKSMIFFRGNKILRGRVGYRTYRTVGKFEADWLRTMRSAEQLRFAGACTREKEIYTCCCYLRNARKRKDWLYEQGRQMVPWFLTPFGLYILFLPVFWQNSSLSDLSNDDFHQTFFFFFRIRQLADFSFFPIFSFWRLLQWNTIGCWEFSKTVPLHSSSSIQVFCRQDTNTSFDSFVKQHFYKKKRQWEDKWIQAIFFEKGDLPTGETWISFSFFPRCFIMLKDYRMC